VALSLLVEVGLNGFSALFDPAAISAIFTQFQTEIHQPQFWVALTKIIWINVLCPSCATAHYF
jgi:hypothetical protein